ncbi:NAD-dependent epimerase/dehydratase family protein [Shouchella sp. 1P09AA]|uniref:NAD-dependent epimerase/dehydratase family protein n=1 Tax=unclassified Shouchella TaxID=2893065 RepID=UPI0039A18AEC
MNKITVIGGLGFFGSHLSGRFLEEGWEVNAIDAMEKNAEEKEAIDMSMGRNANYTCFPEVASSCIARAKSSCYIYAARSTGVEEVVAVAEQLDKDDLFVYLSMSKAHYLHRTGNDSQYEQDVVSIETALKKIAADRSFSILILRAPLTYGLHSEIPLSYVAEKVESNEELLYIDDFVTYILETIQSYIEPSTLEEKRNRTIDQDDILHDSATTSINEGYLLYRDAEKKWIRQNDLK